ncbi:hypothetical protein [Zhongshania sp.]|uniref:hypothetical protein n=1 Tax=Zhongshania sp. TaxID=1971902 RepID=UPI001B4F1F35|nr:hypothetical protein [Zhongshania sp.]MBQ0795209.1 hypothetical protein [Zhongshania sp.]
MSEKSQKVTLIVAYTLLVALALFFSPGLSAKSIIGAIAGSLFGLHLVYAYLFNTTMHITGASFDPGERQGQRGFLFLIGIFTIALCICCLLIGINE